MFLSLNAIKKKISYLLNNKVNLSSLNKPIMTTLRKKPLIVICGCTGTGKTKLSIELAQWLINSNRKAEIINADAMQLYKNLDIITNKATSEEMKGIPHHLIGYLDSTYIKHNVIDYRNKAVELIDKLLQDDIIPILVGGTHYYIHSILWDSLIDDKQMAKIDFIKNETNNNKDDDEIVSLILDAIKSSNDDDNKDDFTIRLHDSHIKTEQMYQHLSKVDVKSVQNLHPNDRRKIIRALQIYYTYGKTKNELLEAKNKQEGSNSFHGPLRYKSACMFSMTCSNSEILNKRLDDRVDQMIKNGLLNEIESFKSEFDSKFPNQTFKDFSRDYQFGIFQSIGFKEFERYFQSKTEAEFENGVNEMKSSTRRYAKYQAKWINNRFIKRANDHSPIIHQLDTVDLENWTENIFNRAKSIFEDYLNNKIDLVRKQGSPTTTAKEAVINEFNKCEICNKIFIDKSQWECHLKGNKHKKRKENLKRKEMHILADQIQTLKKMKEENNSE